MNKDLFDRIVQCIIPQMDDSLSRRALVESTFIDSSLLPYVHWDGSAYSFTTTLVKQLENYGNMPDGRQALVMLLEEIKKRVGNDYQVRLDELIQEFQNIEGLLKSVPAQVLDANDLYIFVSYAHIDQPIAERVEQQLLSAGAHVFIDKSQIHDGANWDMIIEQALNECGHMVLLLSKASMPYRKEVHREWFFFDQKRKPIYPLYLENCELHSRMYSYNYIDASSDLNSALDRLLLDLKRDYQLPDAATNSDMIGVFEGVDIQERTLPEALNDLLEAVSNLSGSIILSLEQAMAIKEHQPESLVEYRLGRIAEWALPRYQLDNRFVNLTLLIDKGSEGNERWHSVIEESFSDLSDVLERYTDPVLVLLGTPGSGKSTLLRRYQLDHSIDCIRNEEGKISFFIQLNSYRPAIDGSLTSPRDWLNNKWSDLYPQLPPLDDYLRSGKVILLLDALNEISHKDIYEYHERVNLWRIFAQDIATIGNRAIFSCRSLDYSASLSSQELRVPQIQVQPMSDKQLKRFLDVYIPKHSNHVWHSLRDSKQIDLFKTPYFLKLLCDQVEANKEVPTGRASLFTGFVRQVLYREIGNELFRPGTLLSAKDHRKLALGRWKNEFELPESGMLIGKLSSLAYEMQKQNLSSDGNQVRIDYDDACIKLNAENASTIISAGISLSILDEDVSTDEVSYFHQLLQEYFAARELSKNPKASLVNVQWQKDLIEPSLNNILLNLGDDEPIPLPPQTGWEETTLTALPMSENPILYLKELMSHNLPLAARCAVLPELEVTSDILEDLQYALIQRMTDANADIRSRLVTGNSLGLLGDPRFKLHSSSLGAYILPPFVCLPEGTYSIGSDDYPSEQPIHKIKLNTLYVAKFPVTNAEFALFIRNGGYEEDRWWESTYGLNWKNGLLVENSKSQWREGRSVLLQLVKVHIQAAPKDIEELRISPPPLPINQSSNLWSTLLNEKDPIEYLVNVQRITSKQGKQWKIIAQMDNSTFEKLLDTWYPQEKYLEPAYWKKIRFSGSNQPVIGVNWFEANAYCKWISHVTGEKFTLLSEAEWEASYKGNSKSRYVNSDNHIPQITNTFETRIRTTTPVGMFSESDTQLGISDLEGNVWEWTSSIFSDYPYSFVDGREDSDNLEQHRVLRGGSWNDQFTYSRSSCRFHYDTVTRYPFFGFRICKR